MQVVNILRFYWVFIIFKYEKRVIVIAPVYDTNIKLSFKSNYNMIFYINFFGIFPNARIVLWFNRLPRRFLMR